MSCVPDELLAFIELSRHFAVISPNILELQSLLSIKPSSSTSEEEVVHATHTFRSILCPNLDKGRDGPAIVVRAGRLGSFTLSEKWSGWVRPFFTPSKQDQRRVVDPTGGGNGFLGGLCAGLLLTDGDFRPGQSSLRVKRRLVDADTSSFLLCSYSCELRHRAERFTAIESLEYRERNLER